MFQTESKYRWRIICCIEYSSLGYLSSDNNFDSKDIKEEENVYIVIL